MAADDVIVVLARDWTDALCDAIGQLADGAVPAAALGACAWRVQQIVCHTDQFQYTPTCLLTTTNNNYYYCCCCCCCRKFLC